MIAAIIETCTEQHPVTTVLVRPHVAIPTSPAQALLNAFASSWPFLLLASVQPAFLGWHSCTFSRDHRVLAQGKGHPHGE